jgi:hypothetical protein
LIDGGQKLVAKHINEQSRLTAIPALLESRPPLDFTWSAPLRQFDDDAFYNFQVYVIGFEFAAKTAFLVVVVQHHSRELG